MPGTPRGSAAGLPAAGGCNGGPHHPQAPSHLNFYYDLCFPICKTRQQQVPGPAQPQAGPHAANSGPGGACIDCPHSHLGRVLSYLTGQPEVGAAPGEQPGPMPGRAVGTGMAQGPWQGGRGHCRTGGRPWASPHGHQQDRAAHTGSRPEPQRGGTHDVIEMTVQWSSRREMGCPSSI